MKNYYEILEVTPEASEEVIKAAYKALVKGCIQITAVQELGTER